MKYYLALIIFLLIHQTSFAKNDQALPKITVTIAPLASITALLTGNKAVINIINSAAGCPHHYNLRPTDRNKILRADLLFYIDKKFDHYAQYFKINQQAESIAFSQFDAIDFQDLQGKNNWHFWLDLDNIIRLLPKLALTLQAKLPILTEEIEKNLPQSLIKLQKLKEFKKEKLANLVQLVIMNQSIEFFVKDLAKNQARKYIRAYQKNYASLNDIVRLKNKLTTENNQCLLIDYSQNPALYQKFGQNIVQLNAENWLINEDNLVNSFFIEYEKMIMAMQNCQIR